MSVGTVKIRADFGNALVPYVISSFGGAPEDMESVLFGSTPRASVIVLILPLDKSCSHSTVVRGMLCNPTSAGRAKLFHPSSDSVPIDKLSCFMGVTFMSDPIKLHNRVLNGIIEGFERGGGNFVVAVPEGPAIVVDDYFGGSKG
jgi:hypothetical protein